MNTFKRSAAKTRIILSLFYLLFYLMGCNDEVMAADASLEVAVPITESAKGDKLKKLLLKHPLNYRPHVSHDEEEQKFCSTFYEDAKANTNIEYIEPVFRANDARDPRFKDYWQCMDLSNHPDDIYPGDVFSNPRGIGTRNYRLYRIGLDELHRIEPVDIRDAEILYDEILYAEYTPDEDIEGVMGGYNFVDLDNCVKSRFAVPIPADAGGRVRENINAFIRYHNQSYVYELEDVNTIDGAVARYRFALLDLYKGTSARCYFTYFNTYFNNY